MNTEQNTEKVLDTDSPVQRWLEERERGVILRRNRFHGYVIIDGEVLCDLAPDCGNTHA